MGKIVCSRASHRLAMFETMPVRDVSSRFVDTVDISCSNAQYTEAFQQSKRNPCVVRKFCLSMYPNLTLSARKNRAKSKGVVKIAGSKLYFGTNTSNCNLMG